MSESLTGSCLCQSIQYIIRGEIKAVANCHCNTCKKIVGGPFQTIAFTHENNLEILKGQDVLAAYRVSEKATKHFCRVCGTPIYNTHRHFPGNSLMQVGSLDDPTIVAPAINVFCENMLPWVKEIGGLPSFDKEPPKK